MREPALSRAAHVPYLALPIALVIGFLSILPCFGLHFDYIPGNLEDNRLNNYLLEHGYKWITGQTSESFFDAPFYYPARASIRYSDNLLGGLPFYIPWRLLGFGRDTSFQIWIILGYMLNYVAAVWVLHKLRLHWFAVLSGAYVFAFSQVVLTHSWHIQLHYRFAIPLAWYFLHLFLQHFRSKHLLAALSFGAWQFYCSIYNGYFLGLFLAAFLLARVCTNGIGRHYIRTATIQSVGVHSLIVLGVALAVGVVARVYVRSAADPDLMSARRPEVISMLPRPLSYLVAFPGSSETGRLYDYIDLPMKHEHVMFVGLIPWSAVLVLLVTATRGARHPEVMPALLAMFLLMGLTLDVNDYSLYFALMNLPGVNGIRAVTRVIMVLLLPFAIATAQVLHLCRAKLQHASTATVVAFLMIVGAALIIENRATPYRYVKEESRNRVRRLVAQLPPRLPQHAVLAYVYPPGRDWVTNAYEVDAMLAAQEKNISTVNGYGAAAPDGFRQLHSCSDIRIALDAIALSSESFAVRDPVSRIVTVGTPVDAPCAIFLTREASTATEPLPAAAFHANIDVTAPPAVTAGSDFLAQVRITNQSDVRWRTKGSAAGQFAVRVSCQWLSPGSQAALMEYPNRFVLPYDLEPDETVSVAVLLSAPRGAGTYTIECDAVQESVHWFHLMGSRTGKTLVQVRREPTVPAFRPSAMSSKPTRSVDGSGMRTSRNPLSRSKYAPDPEGGRLPRIPPEGPRQRCSAA